MRQLVAQLLHAGGQATERRGLLDIATHPVNGEIESTSSAAGTRDREITAASGIVDDRGRAGQVYRRGECGGVMTARGATGIGIDVRRIAMDSGNSARRCQDGKRYGARKYNRQSSENEAYPVA